MHELKHWIGGVEIGTARTILRRAPATAEAFSQTCVGGAEEVARAVEVAQMAARKWSATQIEQRSAAVNRMADWLMEQYGEAGKPTPLKQLISREVGKPLPEADVEVVESADFIRFFAQHAKDALRCETPPLDTNLWATKASLVQYRPRGLIAIIKPWNYPLEMIIWSLAPALLAGNAVIIKPSEKSPVTGSKIREMAEFARLPSGVINIVYGDRETGKCISDAEGIDYITFTGSTAAGRDIAMKSAQRLRPYALELGGNDAAIVLDDVNVELAANGLAWGAFCNAGQVCVGVKRAYVMSGVFDQIAAETVRIAKSLKHGTDLGPIIDEVQLQAVSDFVDDAVRKGAKALSGGRRAPSKVGYFYEPTVLTGVPFAARLLSEECFGPVLPLIRVKSIDEAVERANASKYGLGASVWTSDLARGQAVAERIEAGMVWVNDVNVAFPQTPWGGIKSSGGIGFELSLDALREYTVRKHINIEKSSEVRRPWWYPYDG